MQRECEGVLVVAAKRAAGTGSSAVLCCRTKCPHTWEQCARSVRAGTKPPSTRCSYALPTAACGAAMVRRQHQHRDQISARMAAERSTRKQTSTACGATDGQTCGQTRADVRTCGAYRRADRRAVGRDGAASPLGWAARGKHRAFTMTALWPRAGLRWAEEL